MDISRRYLLWLGASGALSGCANHHATRAPRREAIPGVESYTWTSKGYEGLVGGYNAAYHSVRPELVVLPKSPKEVADVVKLCRDEELALHIRGGGHCFEDLNTGPSVLLDTRYLRDISLSRDNTTLSVGAGATLGQVSQQLLPAGRALPMGTCPSVGVAGLTLGGGYGLLSREHGLTCDALTEAEMVDATGQVKLVSSQVNDDLFWALRGGGGGNFGIVTRLSYSTAAVARRACVLQAPVRRDAVREFLSFWQAWIPDGNERLTPLVYIAATPDGFDGPVILAQYWGARREALDHLAPFLPFVVRGRAEVREVTVLEAAEAFGGPLDAAMKPAYFKGKSHFFKQPLAATAWERLLDALQQPIRGVVGLMLDPWQGAIARVPLAQTAFAHRDALFSIQYRADFDPDIDGTATLEAVDRIHAVLAPYSRGAYLNYSDKALEDWRTAYHGVHLERLVELKRSHDPSRFFEHALSL